MDFSGKPIVGDSSKLLEEAHGGSFTFHGIQIKMVQHIESKARLDPIVACRKYLFLKELHRLVWQPITCAPGHTMLEHPCDVCQDEHIIMAVDILSNVRIMYR
jgi:hypothetical protein